MLLLLVISRNGHIAVGMIAVFFLFFHAPVIGGIAFHGAHGHAAGIGAGIVAVLLGISAEKRGILAGSEAWQQA